MSEKQYDPQIGTIFSKEKDDGGVVSYFKPKLGKYGVKSITVELNNGQLVELSDDSVAFLNDPRERIEYQVGKEKLTRDEADERIAKLDGANVAREVTLKL
jgi:hypothetical protein